MRVDVHVNEVAEQGYTIVEDAIEPDFVDALNDDLLRLEEFFAVEPAPNSFEGHHTIRIYNLLAYGALYERIPVHDHVLPVVEGVLDPGCLISSLSSISMLEGETAQPIHADDQLIPLPKPHPADGVQLHVGAHRLHRSQRRDAPRPRLPPLGPLAELRPGVRLDRSRDAEGIRPDLARQPVARRRGEHHTRPPGRHRDELLRGLHPSAGEPTARPRRETVEGFEPRLRRLVGYSVYNGLIGHINKHSPEQLLLADAPTGSDIIWDQI